MRNWNHIGSGSILNERFVLSAAHSFFGADPGTLQVVANIQRTSDWSNPEIMPYRVLRTIIHPDFIVDTRENDVGLLQTSIPIVFNDRVRSISLGFRTNSFMWMNGFGLNEATNAIDVPLTWVGFSLITNDECKLMLGPSNAEKIFESKFCVLPRDDRIICRIDAGAPMLMDNWMVSWLVGVASWNVPCAHNSPIVMERLSSHLDFINTNIVL